MVAQLFGDDASISRYSSEALALAERHQTPPEPPVYEIWYTYASGENAALNARLDDALAAEQQLCATTIHRIHDEFFATQSLRTGVSKLGGDFEAALDGVVEKLAQGAANGEEFETALQALAAKLVQADTKTAATLVERIAQLNQRYLERLRTLNAELLSTVEEVVDLRKTLRSLQEHAFIDHLTQLNNRRRFDEVIAKEIDAARQSKEQLCIAVADLDHFKQINDLYGHDIGDKVLVKFAEILRKNTKGRDTAARLGGEEFALILPNTSLQGAATLSNRLRTYLCAMRLIDRRNGKKLKRLTVSFGVTRLREEDDVVSLLRRADNLLYEAKAAGRNTVVSDA